MVAINSTSSVYFISPMNENEEQAFEKLLELVKDRNWRLSSGFYLIESKPDNDPNAPGRITPFVMRKEQAEVLATRHTRNFRPKARKLGISTVLVLANGDECLWTPNLFAAVIDKSEGDAFGKLQMFRFAWENGPRHPNPGMAQLWRWVHEANPLTVNNDSELAWSNGSRFEASASVTGNTPNRLHLSELGPISAQFPKKSREIRRGSINAVLPHDIVDIETTMEGGQFGVCWDFCELALSSVGKELSPVDWKFHFYPWFRHPSYRIAGGKPRNEETLEYFEKLRENHDIVLADEQMAFWESKRREQGDDIWQQYPSTIEEATRAVVAGQIYPLLASYRQAGRVCDFEPELGQPLYCFFDLGASDNMAGWLMQPCGKDWNALDWCAGEGVGAEAVAEVIRAWERKFSPMAGVYIPHDANITDKGSGKTYLSQLLACKINPRIVHVVPRIPDVWMGVNEVRKRLSRVWWHSRTDRPVVTPDGDKLPSGVGRLENYRKVITTSGITKSIPFKDGVCDHTADALRTWAEADSLSMITAGTVDAAPRSSRPVTQMRAMMGLRGRAGI